MSSPLKRLTSEQSGIALIVTVLLLLLGSAIVITALNRVGDEQVVASAPRRQRANLAVAEAGLAIIAEELAKQAQASPTPPVIKLDLPSSFKDPGSGLATSVRTGRISDGAPMSVTYLGGAGVAEGNEISAGKQQSSGQRLLYRVEITARDPLSAQTSVQAQFTIPARQSTSY